MMLSETALQQVHDYVDEILPGLLRLELKKMTVDEGMLSDRVLRRDEFVRAIERIEQRTNTLELKMYEGFSRIDERFDQVGQNFDQMQQQIDKHFKQMEVWLKLQLGLLGNEKGTNLEDVFAMALQYGLKNPDIRPESIRLRQKLVDTERLIFKKGFSTEVDMIAENGKLTVFEVKARGYKDQVPVFAMKLDLITLQNPDMSVHGVFITPVPDEEVSQQCAENQIQLVS